MTMRILFLTSLSFVLAAPLVQSNAGSLSFTLFDFAEWASLLPAERHASPALLLSFTLRLQLVVVFLSAVYFLTMRSTRFNWLGTTVAVGVVTLSQLPPLEFLTHPNDPNYQQQLLIALLFLAASVTIVALASFHYTKYTLLVLHVIGTGLFLLALTQTHAYLTQYQIPYQLGLAAPALLFTYAISAALILQSKRAPQRPSIDPA
ncbi:MAG: hypothetical protein SNJ54_15280 [Anaerolineae bacterium]